jgi:hypothetical protein
MAKKRLPKRASLDEMKLRELMHGPGTCLLAGEGYEYSRLDRPRPLTWAERTEMLAEMRADWERHRDAVMAAWAAEERPAGQRPWAERFDKPMKEKRA